MALDPRIIYHPHNPNRNKNTKVVFVKVSDSIYQERFDFEALDAEDVKVGFRTHQKITCIPFISYKINKGDIVHTDSKQVMTEKNQRWKRVRI